MSAQLATVFTIGHSNRSLEALTDQLLENGIDAIADVRSAPYSARMPWFNREPLTTSLAHAGIQYVFLGDELGGRASGRGLIGPDGRVLYRKMAQTDSFSLGLTRVIDGSASRRIALLCSEKDPLNCHRGLLVARQLALRGVPITHILGPGITETHEQFQDRLLKVVNMPPELTRTEDEILDEAYDKQASRVAYQEKAQEQGDA